MSENLHISFDTTEYINNILKVTYPANFDLLHDLQIALENCSYDIDTIVLDSILIKISRTWEDLYMKEKLVLFPYILQLNSQNKQVNNCNTLNNIRQHFNLIKIYINNFRHNLEAEESNEIINDLKLKMQNFDTAITYTQHQKEIHLYNQLNCDKCS